MSTEPAVPADSGGSNAVRIVVAWAVVSIPLAWGIYVTLQKVVQLFK